METLTPLVTVDENCPSLVEYLRGFSITCAVMQKAYAITRCMYELAEDAHNDGVTYLEVRFSPILHVNEGLGLSAVMEAVCEGKTLAESRMGIVVHIIVCGLRHLPGSVSENLAEIAWRFRHRGVVAFDLAGPEAGFSSKGHKEAFDVIRKHSLNCTLHAGEAAGWESVWDSIRHCGAHRIGHGVALRTNKRLLQYVVDQAIAVEVCVTSNLQTKAIASVQEHPLLSFFESGVRVVPCTDNRTVSGVTLSGEYALIQDKLGFAPWQILKLLDNGFSSAFMSHSARSRLRQDAFHKSLRVLRDAGYDLAPLLHRFRDSLSLGDLEAAVERSGRYWRGIPPPALTEEVIRSIPKPDLHCRLDGSVSPETLWALYQALPEPQRKSTLDALLPGVTSLAELRSFLHSRDTPRAAARRAVRAVLQTPEQISASVNDILAQVAADGISYLELMVRPFSHLADGGEPGMDGDEGAEVVQHVLTALAKHRASHPSISGVGVVIYVSFPEDDPVRFLTAAKIAVKFRDLGICGFGAYGQDITDFSYYQATFDFLKINHINVAINAGTEDANTVTAALNSAGAVRLGRCFVAESKLRVLDYITSHRIPVELGLSGILESKLAKVRTFAGHPLRLFLDQGVVVDLCSFERSFTPMTLSSALTIIAKECSFSCMDLVQMICNGFDKNFQSYQVRQSMRRAFFDHVRAVFKDHLTKKIVFEPRKDDN